MDAANGDGDGRLSPYLTVIPLGMALQHAGYVVYQRLLRARRATDAEPHPDASPANLVAAWKTILGIPYDLAWDLLTHARNAHIAQEHARRIVARVDGCNIWV